MRRPRARLGSARAPGLEADNVVGLGSAGAAQDQGHRGTRASQSSLPFKLEAYSL